MWGWWKGAVSLISLYLFETLNLISASLPYPKKLSKANFRAVSSGLVNMCSVKAALRISFLLWVLIFSWTLSTTDQVSSWILFERIFGFLVELSRKDQNYLVCLYQKMLLPGMLSHLILISFWYSLGDNYFVYIKRKKTRGCLEHAANSCAYAQGAACARCARDRENCPGMPRA